LTAGAARVTGHDVSDRDLANASALAALSRHPTARAVAALTPSQSVVVDDFREEPGQGVQGRVDGNFYRLGRMGWACAEMHGQGDASVWLSRNGEPAGSFVVSDDLRHGAREAVRDLKRIGLP